MALGDRKIPDVFNKNTGVSADARSITSEKELEIKAEYDAGVHVADDGIFNTIAPALYAIQKLSEDIDELRRYITAEVGDGAQGPQGPAGADGAAGTTDASQLDASTLPTSRPKNRNKLWNNGGVVNVS